MAKAYGVTHKCAINVAGVSMLARVVRTLTSYPSISRVIVSTDAHDIAQQSLGSRPEKVEIVASAASAAASAIAAIAENRAAYPVLVTTGDHPLLNHAMLDYFLGESNRSGADLCVGLATAETIFSVYPGVVRTFLTFGRDRVSGCNLFALMNEKSNSALTFWSHVEGVRKKPWRLVRAFGLRPLLRYASGTMSLNEAFRQASMKLHLEAVPVLMPFAEASIDVDKPSDMELVERILSKAG
jgi:CTP:molybdopterin cytidylyltransferase MocA